uniref:Uncharacterized protein n=1 Tax=Eiseniibacteriota bacterium TaxID=2212470 RepID=A0A832I3C1_UNCEI
MSFLEAWSLPSIEIALLALPALCLAVPLLVPGARVAALAALATAAACAGTPLLDAPAPLRAGWVLLWAAIGVGLWRAPAPRAAPPGRGAGLEAAAIGLAVGGGLFAVLAFAAARQDLPAPLTRRLSLGLMLIGLGLLHLMLRRHVVRASAGFAALAFGVQVMEGAARGVAVPPPAGVGASALLAGALAAGLAFRVGEARRRHAGSAWVSDAHDLHD